MGYDSRSGGHEVIGQIVRGDFSEIIVRQKSGREIEIGDLFFADTSEGYVILEAFDLVYGSQIGELSRELIAGLRLEGYENLGLYDESISNYTLARLKPLVSVSGGKERIPKTMPKFFSDIRPVTEKELMFLGKPESPLFVGKMRSGSKEIGIDVFLKGKEVLRHHVLIAATTGRGKSNLVKVLASSVLKDDYCSLLILDPHDEYKELGCVRYSSTPSPGARGLVFSIETLRPAHLEDMASFSTPQTEALYAYNNRYGNYWVKELVMAAEEDAKKLGVFSGTLGALQRKFNVMLGIRNKDGALECSEIFDTTSGTTTISDICKELESGKSVIIDTSLISSDLEILAGSMIAKEILSRYKRYKLSGALGTKPIISVVLEEAPRVLNKDALEKGNIFASIAREGRKFGIGLVAVTQLPSLIPKEILANINTKIILGTELASERNAIIESAAQDLGKDDRNIASLDVGEAIITSNFTRFAVPVKIPKFDSLKQVQKEQGIIRFTGMRG